MMRVLPKIIVILIRKKTSRKFSAEQRQKRKQRPVRISAIRIRGNLMQKIGDMYYFINDITGYRLNVVDAACGSRFYNFEKTKDGGTTWTEVNGDPFDQNMGVAEGLLFFTNDFGFAGLTYASEDFSMLYVTKDGGETFERLELPLDTVTELPSEAAELGFTIEDYDYHTMPQIVDGKMEIYLQTDAMEQQGIIFQSEDNGVTWEYAGCKE